MSFGQDPGPGTLAYVTRAVDGDVLVKKAVYDKKEQKIVRKEAKIESPVIVFMANGTSIVMSGAQAERFGFLEQPPILNFDAVTDAKTAAGRYKFSMNMRTRQMAFQEMEQGIISLCISKHGHPLPQGAAYSKESVYMGDEFAYEGIAAKETVQ